MENDAIPRIKMKVEEMRDRAYEDIQKSMQTNEIVYHRAEMETLERVLKIIEAEN